MKKRPKVVTAAAILTEAGAPKFGDQLCAALGSHHVVIADLTQTRTCDLAAIGEICVANDLARSSSRKLRIVISSAAILRQFALAGLDVELVIYPSLSLAAEPGTDMPAGRLRWGTASPTSARSAGLT